MISLAFLSGLVIQPKRNCIFSLVTIKTKILSFGTTSFKELKVGKIARWVDILNKLCEVSILLFELCN